MQITEIIEGITSLLEPPAIYVVVISIVLIVLGVAIRRRPKIIKQMRKMMSRIEKGKPIKDVPVKSRQDIITESFGEKMHAVGLQPSTDSGHIPASRTPLAKYLLDHSVAESTMDAIVSELDALESKGYLKRLLIGNHWSGWKVVNVPGGYRMKYKRIIVEMMLGAKEELRRRTHGLRRFFSTRRIYAYIVVALFLFTFMSALSMEGLFLQHPVVGMNTSNKGEQRLLVLPVFFPDVYPSTTIEQIGEVMSGVDGYIQELTYGQTWTSARVLDWILLDNSATYYGAPGPDEDQHDTYRRVLMVKEAITKVDTSVDYNDYDKVVVYHAGYGEQSTGARDDPERENWLETARIGVYHLTDDMVVVESAVVVPELSENHPSIGAIVHELGHEFGADDLYDPLYGPDIENWCLMSSGNKLNTSDTPCHMCLYSKLSVGFLQDYHVVPITNGTYTFEIVAISVDAEGYYGAKYLVNNSKSEYYLLEARKQVGFDSALERSGILVTIVNESLLSQEGRVLLASDPRYPLGQRVYGPGEYFVDMDSGFGFIVINETEVGYFVEVTTSCGIGWERSSLILHELHESYGGSMIALRNGTIFLAVEGLNASTGHSQIDIYRSNNLGVTWDDVFSTPSMVDRISPVLVAHREQWFDGLANIVEYKPYMFCETTFSSNHTIEAWDLTSYQSHNITTLDVDARTPTATTSGPSFFLAFEIWNLTSADWVLENTKVALSSGYGIGALEHWSRTISNASGPSLSSMRLSNMGANQPFLAYECGPNSTYKNEIHLRRFDFHNSLIIHSGDANVSKPKVAVNEELNLTMVVFETWTEGADSAWLHGEGYTIVSFGQEAIAVLKADEIGPLEPLSGAPLASWGLTPEGNRAFYLGARTSITSCFLIDQDSLEVTSTYTRYHPTPHVLSTHDKALRWMHPIICEMEPSATFVYTYVFIENAHYDYFPVFVEPQIAGPSINLLFVPSMFMVFLIAFIALVSWGTRKRMFSVSRHQFLTAVLLVLTLMTLVMINYILAGLFSAFLVFSINFMLQFIFVILAAFMLHDFFIKEGASRDDVVNTS